MDGTRILRLRWESDGIPSRRVGTDAHIDVRGRLTAESYLAAARLVIEAGGWVIGLDGAPLRSPENLTDRVSLIAASSRQLGDNIVEFLGDEQH